MAVTKIWKVTDRFDKLINYAMNPEKTDVDIEKYHPVKDLIKYAADGDKTEKCFYTRIFTTFIGIHAQDFNILCTWFSEIAYIVI